MFAPSVAKQKTKSTELHRAPVAQKRHGQPALSPVQLLQRRIGNQALTRLLAQDGNDLGALRNTARLPGVLQAKLKIGAINDPREHEADRTADQVMRMPAPASVLPSAPEQVSRKCAECEEEIQRKEAGTAEPVADEVPASVHEVLRSPGQPLDAATRGFMEPRFGHDFSQVRVHADGEASRAARAVHAKAYTFGRDIVFGSGEYAPETVRGRRLLAHELTHIVQQRAAAAASSVALHIEGNSPTAAGKGMRLVAPPILISRAPGPMLAFDTSEAEAIAGVEAKLAEVNPIAGVGDPSGAIAVLARVSDDQTLLKILEHLETNYQLEQLRSANINLPYEQVQRLAGAMQAVHFAHAQPGTVSQSEINEFVKRASNFTDTRRTLFIRHILEKRGVDKDMLTATLEGVSAVEESQSGAAVPDPSVQAVAGAVQPAPWSPPGGQAIPFYLGNEAHIAIAGHYRASHTGDQVFTNYVPISTILAAWEVMGNTVTAGTRAASLGLKPDIANLTRTHLYEIKPTGSATLAVAEATVYQQIFARAGVPMALGPTNESGTAGAVPAPAGVYIFESPLPGAITYQYRRAKVVPVPVPQRQKAPSTSRFKVPKFELRPLTDAELRQLGFNIAVVTTIGLGLLLILVLLAPVGA